MKDTILITGGNGHLAKAVGKYLYKDYNIRYLTTKKKSIIKDSYFYWDIEKKYIDTKAIKSCKHIIHLAGHPILKKWTVKNKRAIYNSRIKSTNLLFETCRLMDITPSTIICASAIGIYEKNSKNSTHEDSLKGNDWVAKMACDWENSSNKFTKLGSRVVQIRISLIFSEHAGFLKYNLLSMKYGIGLIIGNKKRTINWMHVNDISRFIKESITNNRYKGPYNLACDDKISQDKLITLIKRKIHPYSIIIKIPIFLISLLIGNRSQIINSDINLVTNRMNENGFKCKYNSFEKMLEKIKNNL